MHIIRLKGKRFETRRENKSKELMNYQIMNDKDVSGSATECWW